MVVDPVLCYLAGSAALKYAMMALWGKQPPPSVERVGTVSRITLFPVKSAKGIDLEQVECSYTGVQDGLLQDRRWLVIDSQGTMVTGRARPQLALIRPSWHGNVLNVLHLDAPGMDTLKVNISNEGPDINTRVFGLSTSGIDCGDEVASWLSSFLGDDQYRLLYHSPSHAYRRMDYYHKVAQPGDQIAYHDCAPLLLASEASLSELNQRLDEPVTMDSFRPNIVVATNGHGFDEDKWQEIYIGKAKFSNVTLCDRCLMTLVDPERGSKKTDGEPLKTLRKFRKVLPSAGDSPCFGVYLRTDWQATIRVGDAVYVLR